MQLLLPSEEPVLAHRLHAVTQPWAGQLRVTLSAEPGVLGHRGLLRREPGTPRLYPRPVAVTAQLEPEREQPRRPILNDHIHIGHDNHLDSSNNNQNEKAFT